MRHVMTTAALSTALVAGLLAAATPASASPAPTGPAVEDTVVYERTIPGTELLARAGRDGVSYSPQEARAIKKSSCRTKEHKRGLRAKKRNGKKGRWLIWVKLRLHWCYDGYQVTLADARAQAYSYDRRTWRWRGWAKKKLYIKKDGSAAVAEAKAKFYYTGNRKVYKPHIGMWGAFNGSSDWWGWKS